MVVVLFNTLVCFII